MIYANTMSGPCRAGVIAIAAAPAYALLPMCHAMEQQFQIGALGFLCGGIRTIAGLT